jgi:hypothetical protein
LPTKNEFQRTFLIFENEDRGFDSGQRASGFVSIETRDGKGKLKVLARNLKGGSGNPAYKLQLINSAANITQAVSAGLLRQDKDRYELEWDFDPVNVARTGTDINGYDVIAIVADSPDRPSGLKPACPLVAYRGEKRDWRSKIGKPLHPEFVSAEKYISMVSNAHDIPAAGKPAAPFIPSALSAPIKPIIPTVPTAPTAHVTPAAPVMPARPAMYGTPAAPEAPVIPAAPVMPEMSAPYGQKHPEAVPEQRFAYMSRETEPDTAEFTEQTAEQEIRQSTGQDAEPIAEQEMEQAINQAIDRLEEQTADQSEDYSGDTADENDGAYGRMDGEPDSGRITTCLYADSETCQAYLNDTGANPCEMCQINSIARATETGEVPAEDTELSADGRATVNPGDVAMLKKELDRNFDASDPFKIKRSDYKWWKVTDPVSLNNILFRCNIKTALLFNPAVMMAHVKYRHVIAGIYTDREKRKEYLVFGIPGMHQLDRKPFGEVSRWVQSDGYRLRQGSFGYWLVYLDPETGRIMRLK